MTGPFHLWETHNKKHTMSPMKQQTQWCESSNGGTPMEMPGTDTVLTSVHIYLWAGSSTQSPDPPKNAPTPAVSWLCPLLDQLDSSFLVLFRSASAHRRWGLGSSLRKDLQWGKWIDSRLTKTKGARTQQLGAFCNPTTFLIHPSCLELLIIWRSTHERKSVCTSTKCDEVWKADFLHCLCTSSWSFMPFSFETTLRNYLTFLKGQLAAFKGLVIDSGWGLTDIYFAKDDLIDEPPRDSQSQLSTEEHWVCLLQVFDRQLSSSQAAWAYWAVGDAMTPFTVSLARTARPIYTHNISWTLYLLNL